MIVRSPLELGREVMLDALIDTGSHYTIVESSSVMGWAPLPTIGRRYFAGAGGQYSSDIFMVEIEIPVLNFREVTGITFADLGGRQAVLGRNQLRDCILTYDGPKGTVQLRK
jgi:predicted aspartyl protease